MFFFFFWWGRGWAGGNLKVIPRFGGVGGTLKVIPRVDEIVDR